MIVELFARFIAAVGRAWLAAGLWLLRRSRRFRQLEALDRVHARISKPPGPPPLLTKTEIEGAILKLFEARVPRWQMLRVEVTEFAPNSWDVSIRGRRRAFRA